MSVVVSPLHLASQRPGLLGTLFAREPVFAGTALMMLAMMPPTLLAMAFDARTLDGVNVWIKPLKFEIALALYLGTLAWFAGWLPSGYLRSRTHRLLAPAVAFATAAEMAWIGGAAHMGVASHFRRSARAADRPNVVRKGGFEPPQPSGHRILNPARLPVPPLSRGHA